MARLRDALDRLRLNDSSFTVEAETSDALGFGFRCGFLGLLHMEVIQERLDREFGVDIINTVPNVKYKVVMNDGSVLVTAFLLAFSVPPLLPWWLGALGTVFATQLKKAGHTVKLERSGDSVVVRVKNLQTREEKVGPVEETGRLLGRQNE